MPRRTTRRTTSNSPRRRSKYKSAFNIKQAGLGYAGISVLTNGLFNLNPVQFIAGTGARSGGGLQGGFDTASGTLNISIREIFDWVGQGNTSATLQEAIWTNVKKNSLMMVGGMIGIKVADMLISKSGIARTFNRGIRAVNLGGLVKM